MTFARKIDVKERKGYAKIERLRISAARKMKIVKTYLKAENAIFTNVMGTLRGVRR